MLGLGLLLLAVSGAGLLVWQAPRPQPGVVQAPGHSPSAPDQPAPAASTPALRPAVATLVAAAASSAAAVTDANKEFVDICGVGRVRRSDMEQGEGRPEPAWSQALNRQSEQGLADVLKRMQAGSLRQRAAAAVLLGDTQAAAQLAAATDDAMAYRLAFRACRKDADYRWAYAYEQVARTTAPAASGFVRPEMVPPGPVPKPVPP